MKEGRGGWMQKTREPRGVVTLMHGINSVFRVLSRGLRFLY